MFENIDTSLIDWSRAQFALTAMYHWLFVPLTLGLAVIMGLMETFYVTTGKEFWKNTAKFWMKLFGINFAVGVATGLILEFEFGTNWSNYSWFVGDIFGAPLAIEGILAFFMEATFIAVMFFGWNKVSKRFHLASTWLTGLGATISAWWILVANAWMQYPVGMAFNPETVRNEMVDFATALSAEEKIKRGQIAIAALDAFRKAHKAGDEASAAVARKTLDENVKYFGYGYIKDPTHLVPNVELTFWSFRIMVGLGGYFILFFIIVLIASKKEKLADMRWLQRVALWTIPLAYIGSQAGWVVAEVGRQPWAIQDMLPVGAAISKLQTGSVQLTFFIFLLLFTVLLFAEIGIMLKAIKKGPEGIKN